MATRNMEPGTRTPRNLVAVHYHKRFHQTKRPCSNGCRCSQTSSRSFGRTRSATRGKTLGAWQSNSTFKATAFFSPSNRKCPSMGISHQRNLGKTLYYRTDFPKRLPTQASMGDCQTCFPRTTFSCSSKARLREWKTKLENSQTSHRSDS